MKKAGISHDDLLSRIERAATTDDPENQLKELLLRFRNEDNTRGIAHCLKQLCTISLRKANYPALLEQSLEAIELFEKLDDKRNEANCLNSLGFVYNYLHDHESRLKCNQRCLHLREESEDYDAIVGTLNNLGDTHLQLGHFDEALRYFNIGLEHPNLSDRNACFLKHNIGETYLAMNELGLALDWFRKAIAGADAIAYKVIQCVSREFLADALIRCNLQQDALPFIEESMEIAKAEGYLHEEVKLLHHFSKVYEALGEKDRAYEYFKDFHNLRERIYNDETVQQIKNIQFQNEAESLRRITEAERSKNEQLRKAFSQIEAQKDEINTQNLAITDSIRYAKILQNAMLPNRERLLEHFGEAFILYKPKDIVSGDFFWMREAAGRFFYAVADCTGHGVPGAFLSIVCMNLLDRAITEFHLHEPADILQKVNELVREIFAGSEERVQDGMDIAMCAYDPDTNDLTFSGANNPLYLVSDAPKDAYSAHLVEEGNERRLFVFKGNKLPIGNTRRKYDAFSQDTLKLKKDDLIYLFSDGYADQFGGPRGKKFKYAQLRKVLLQLADEPLDKQDAHLWLMLEQWQGDLEQVDDVCVLGVRV